MTEPITKMKTKIVRELRDIAKELGLHGYYNPRKTGLIALLSEKSTEEMSATPPRELKSTREGLNIL